MDSHIPYECNTINTQICTILGKKMLNILFLEVFGCPPFISKHVSWARAYFFLIIFILFTLPLSTAYAESFTTSGAGIFRIAPSKPDKLLTGVYNSVILGNYHLADIEQYMSRSLKSLYKTAMKQKRKGASCDVPLILINNQFAGKVKSFKIENLNISGSSAEATVVLNTASENLSSDSPLKKYDPFIYEKIVFKFSRTFIDWKIDNISVSEPDLDNKIEPLKYKSIDLVDVLKGCR